MSGINYSRVEIEKMRKAHQEALQKVFMLKSTIDSLSNQAESLLAGIPQGVKQAFHGDIEQIKKLLSNSAPNFTSSQATSFLNDIERSMNTILESRRKAIRLLCNVREEKREQKARELFAAVEEIKGEWDGMSGLLDKWRPGELSSQVSRFYGVDEQIAKGDFVAVNNTLSLSRDNLKRFSGQVSALETQDQERRFVLGALRDVCVNDMGWKEVGVSVLKIESNPESPIIAKFNTYSDGIIEFVLRMDGIESHSDFSNEKHGCYKQFDSISEKLKSFGVTTRFRHKGDEDEDPRLIRKGELDEPHGAEVVGVMHKEF